ncbi:MAG: isocitrate lyase/phosphoenolpyruvate mutase family protein [Pseudomonadota bacterium]
MLKPNTGLEANPLDKRAVFKRLHQQNQCFVMPNPWDIGSSVILEKMGFKALATTSAGAAYAQGKRDGKMLKDEVFAHCREIVSATQCPVSADLENGFGSTPEHVYQTVKKAAEIGLAGCSIEDFTGDPQNPLYELKLACERIEAARQACHELSHDFVLTARCELLCYSDRSWEEAMARLISYQNVGADVLYAPKLPSIKAVSEVAKNLEKPLNVVMGLGDQAWDFETLQQAGVKRVSVGSSFARLAYGEVIKAALTIKDQGRFVENAAGFKTIEQFFD